MPPPRGRPKLDRAADQLRPFAHRDQAQPGRPIFVAQTPAMILHLELEGVGSKRTRTQAWSRPGMTRDVVQGLLQHAIDVDADRACPPRLACPLVHTIRQRRPDVPASRSTTRSSVRALPLRESMDGATATGRGHCRVSSARSRPISRSSARSGEPSGACLPARPSIDPIAVRIWPNSSCSSREISRSVDSRVAISCCASSRRWFDSEASLGEQLAV